MNTLHNTSTANDELYTRLIDVGVDPGFAYQEVFVTGYDFEADVEENGGVTSADTYLDDIESAVAIPTL